MLSSLNRFAGRITEDSRESAFTIFRLLVAAMFLTHGYDKLLGESPQEPLGAGMTSLRIADFIAYEIPYEVNLLFVAGVVELGGGILILIGLWTHLIALVALITMSLAYAIAHLAWFPTLNGGELAALYWAAFLLLFTGGAGPLSLDNWLELRRQAKRQKKIDELSK